MVDVATALLLLVALVASFFAAWTIGAGSTGATPFAPAVGAGAIPTMRAAFIVGFLGFAGAVLQGAAVTDTVGRGLIDGITLSPLAATVALSIAAIYIAAGVFKGYPIATAFAISGSVAGVGLAMGGDPAWRRWGEISLYWLLTPFIVGPASYATTRLLLGEFISESRFVPLLGGVVGAVIANMEFLFLGPAGEQASVASVWGAVVPGPALVGIGVVTLLYAAIATSIVGMAVGRDPVWAQKWFLLLLGALVAFTAGGGKVGLAVGPLLPLFEGITGTAPMTAVLVFGGFGMLAGTWMLAPRMIKALSQDYSDLGPRRSIGVLIPSFVIAQVGIFFGIPMSFNEIFISAIAGTGYAAGSGEVSQSKLFYTALAWIGSLVFSFVVGYAVYAGIVHAMALL